MAQASPLRISCEVEPTAFTHHVLLVIRRTVFVFRERHKLTLCGDRNSEFVSRTTPSRPTAGSTVTAIVLSGAKTAIFGATATNFTTPHSSSWADEVAAKQSGRSTPETVFPHWAFSGRIPGSRPRSQTLTYTPPAMPTPLSFSTTTPSHIYGPQSLHFNLN